MTVGIYKLTFASDPKIYIGQSSNVEKRIYSHNSLLRNGKHPNIKLQSMYNKYGDPVISLLEEVVAQEDLDDREYHYILKFDTINNGLNIALPLKQQRGLDAPSSKYTEEEISLIFTLLVYSNMTTVEIANISNLPKSLVNSISNGYNHLWLKEKYPEEYLILEGRRSNTRSSKSFKTGIEYRFFNKNTKEVAVVSKLSEFINKYNLSKSCVSRVVSKERKSHKGWILIP